MTIDAAYKTADNAIYLSYLSAMNEEKEVRTLDQLYALRKQVVRLSLSGKAVMEIVALTGLSWTGVRKALDLYESGGIAALKPARRGRKTGSCRVLSPEEERRIRAIICDKRPEQLKMDFALWSRAAVMALIKQECGIDLQVRSVGKYLARWGFTPQKPIRKAYEQNEAAVKQWLSTRQEKIEIFYLPSYSPELNPEERLNGDLKQAIGKKVPIRTKAKFRAATTAHMEQLEREPERVMAYFRDPHVRYAA